MATSRWDDFRWGDALWNEELDAAAAPGAQGRQAYILEVADGSGTLLARLPYFGGGVWTQQVNKFPSINFTYPFDDAAVSNFVKPNTMVLRDNTGQAIDRFHISTVTKARNSSGERILTVFGEGLLWQLGGEYIDAYDTGGAVTVMSVIADLFSNYQLNGVVQQLYVGTIDAAIATATTSKVWDNTNILQALHQIRKEVGGFFYVDDEFYFHWKKNVELKTGQEFRLTKNMPGLEETTDYRTIATRLYGKGWGARDGDRLESEQNDAVAQGVYGIVGDSWSNQDIRIQGELDTITANVLAQLKDPRIDYEAEVMDLSFLDSGVDYSHESIRIGARVRVVDSELGVTIETNIGAIQRSLSQPTKVKVKFIDPAALDVVQPTAVEDIIEDIANILEKLKTVTDHDTGIYDYIWDPTSGTGHLNDWINNVLGTTTFAASNAVPEDVAEEGAAGTDDEYSRGDHVHKGSYVPLSSTTPEDVVTTGAAGTGADVSRDDHVHKGQPFITAANEAALATAMTADGTIGYTTGGTKRGYMRVDGSLVCITHSVA